MFGRSPLASFLLVVWIVAAAAAAEDVWENGVWGSDDDNQSINTLSHGIVQTHDLDEGGTAVNDQDWMVVPQILFHTYEARVSGSNVPFGGSCPSCASFERVTSGGAVIQGNASILGGFQSNDRTIRWMGTNTAASEFIRVSGTALAAEGPSDVYTIRFWDTTYSIPRWNNSNGQVTVFLISSMVPMPVNAQIHFYNPAGTFLLNYQFTLAPRSLLVLSTASLPTLQNSSGHAYIAHDAGYGGLAGKAVALEPATGFSFDTPMVPIPN